jgi:hypothetical protein
MPNDKEYHLEVLGTCMTNTTPHSQFDAKVEAKYLWSYAQEEALVALSEQGGDKCWRLITDPERRAKRIAARYADLYFQSADKSQGQVQLYWVALAAFVVKDIVEAYRYARESVLSGRFYDVRTSMVGTLASEAFTSASPYEHAERVYAALAKGNLWLFMDIYPWMWFFLEYGFNKDGTLNKARLTDSVDKRDWSTFQEQSKKAIEELPFGPNWTARLTKRMGADPVYTEASKFFSTRPAWTGSMDSGYGQHVANSMQAHRYVIQNIASYDAGYHSPPSKYWHKFSEAFYVMEEERIELKRVAADSAAMGRLTKIRSFKATKETYQILIAQAGKVSPGEKFEEQKAELVAIANQEQINVLQPLIYEDKELINTMNANHWFARHSWGIATPYYKVVYSAQATTNDNKLKTVFDGATGPIDWMTGAKKSLPNQNDRMKYVADIAKDFNLLMEKNRSYMDGELQKIRGWLGA